MTPKSIVITGGAGFIGSHLMDAALNSMPASAITVVDDLSTGKRGNLKEGINFLNQKVVDGLPPAEVFVHLAAMPSVSDSVADPSRHLSESVANTLSVLEAARKCKARRVVYASSAAVYGNDPTIPNPKCEATRLSPASPYGAGKAAGEMMMRSYAETFGIDTVSLRFFNVFGPRQDPKSQYSGVLSIFCSAAKAGKDVSIFGDGSQTRDFVYVDDIVGAILLAIGHPTPLGGSVFNIGTGSATDLNSVVGLLNLRCMHVDERAGDIKHSWADIDAARKTLGYAPAVSFKEGLERTLASI